MSNEKKNNVGMSGLEFLKQANINMGELDSFFGVDITNIINDGEISEKDLDKFKDILNTNNSILDINEKDAKKMRDVLENNPDVFKNNLIKRLKSDAKRMGNGNLTNTSFLKSFQYALLDKKPSKSKYTRKKNKK